MNNNLIFHYQSVKYPRKEGIFLHEAFSTRNGVLYSVNPLPAEVSGDTEGEVEEVARAMEADSTKYRPVSYSKLIREMDRWVDEVEITQEIVVPEYEDDEQGEQEYYSESGEVLDIVDFMKRNK